VTSAERANINDPATMRALAHPVRLELLEYLSLSRDGATATECATVVGLTPSATSYHLRALAKVGMIQEAPGRGDGRERVWQATHRGFSIATDQDAGAADLAAEASMVEVFLARQNEKVRRFFARQQGEPSDWHAVATVTDQVLVATAAELAELLARIDELVDPLRRIHRDPPPEGTRSVTFQIRAVPLED
jgi:DNA-binding transcriptional ArsR family regulator